MTSWSEDQLVAANEDAAPRLTADRVVGTMPNIPANRIHAQRDFRGFGFTVSSEELSGIAALRIGVRALRRGELDTVVAGAVDMCCEPVHARASDALAAGESGPHGDAAVAFVLKRRVDAEAAGEEIIAVVDTEGVEAVADANFAAGRFGRTHAASAATEVAARAAALRARVRVDQSGAQPAPGGKRAAIWLESIGGRADGITVSAAAGSPEPLAVGTVPVSERYAGDGRGDLQDRLARREPGGNGPVRCSLVADGESTLEALRREAVRRLDRGETPAGIGVAFTDAPIAGELAFVFTGAAATYPGAGRDLLLAWPEIGDALAPRFSGLSVDRSLLLIYTASGLIAGLETTPALAGERRRASLRSRRRTISSTQRLSSESLIQPGMKTTTVSPSRRALTMRLRRSLRRTSTTAGCAIGPP